MPLSPNAVIDVSFNMETDAGGKDPDSHSPTLRRYHQMLWSKPLPGGTVFELETPRRGCYLRHASDLGEFLLSSDSIVHSYCRSYANRIGSVLAQVPAVDVDQVHDEGSTIVGYLVFPGNARSSRLTINGARGMHPSICDRIDLTLECIRRHYLGQDNKLARTLDDNADFFALFGNFTGYVDFFLLQDLIDPVTGDIRWYLPFDDFQRSALPTSAEEYDAYRQNVLAFVRSRNDRIADWASRNIGM